MENKKIAIRLTFIFTLLLSSLVTSGQVVRLKMKDLTERQEKIKSVTPKYLFISGNQILLNDIEEIFFTKFEDAQEEFKKHFMNAGIRVSYDGVDRIENSPLVQSNNSDYEKSLEIRLQDLENRVQDFRVTRALGKGLQIGGILLASFGATLTNENGEVSNLLIVGTATSLTGWVIDIGAGGKLKKK